MSGSSAGSFKFLRFLMSANKKVDGELRYRGVVEWGFKARHVLRLLRDARIFRQQTSPFADVRTMRSAVWMEPRLLAEISYAEIVDGRLRAPSWRGLVHDECAIPLR